MLYDSGYVVYDAEDNKNNDNYNNIFFSTLNEYGCSNYEYDLGTNPLDNIYDRRNVIESKWKAYEKCSLESLQKLANRYFGTDVTLEYTGDAEIIYHASLGFKYKYTEDTYNAWEHDNSVVFPAHMVMSWEYDKNRWHDYYYSKYQSDDNFTGKLWSYVNTRTWDATLNKEIDYDVRN